MNDPIFLAILGFILGIFATIFGHSLSRYWRYHDGRRKRKIEHLQKISEWMESYRTLFNCKYPQFLELILAHKMLSPEYSLYDKTAPIRLYIALKEYRDTKAKHEEIARKGYASLQWLSDRTLDSLYMVNLALSFALRHLGILQRQFFLPVSFKSDITWDLDLIAEYRYKIFDEFTNKAIHHIEWEKLDSINPDELLTIIHPWLKYYDGNETEAEYREREIQMCKEMKDLSFYRSEAQRTLEKILSKIDYQIEEKLFTPDN